MELLTEATLSDSVLYNAFNNDAKITKTIMQAIHEGIVIDKSYIEEQLYQIKRSNISPLTTRTLESFENGDITILYNKNIKIPMALPFIVTKINGKIKAFIFISNFGKISKSNRDSSVNYLDVPMKNLYVLLEGAYVTLKYHKEPNSFKRSLGLMRVVGNIYSQMVMTILNKEYALSMEPTTDAEVNFAISYFFMKYIWNSENDSVNLSYALNTLTTSDKTYMRSTNKFEEIADEMSRLEVNTISKLIEFISKRSNRLSSLNFRYFTQAFINTYKAPATFGMECLPYLLFIIEAAMSGSFMVNTPMISNITSGIVGLNKFYPELTRVVV